MRPATDCDSLIFAVEHGAARAAGPAERSRDVDPRAVPKSVVDLFEQQVDAGPERDAVRRIDMEANENVSFGRLDAWANSIASELLARRGPGPEPVPLAVCAPDLMLAAALGVLKAGKFYVAVNPMYPMPHVRRVLDELEAPLLLCDRRGEVAAEHGGRALSVEEIVAARSSDGRPDLRVDEGRFAYVLYTSGSTGRPRGVAQSRRDMLHNVERHRPLGVGQDDCVTLISADGFVASVSNPFVGLLSGATLAPYSFRDGGVDRMMDWLDATSVTVLYAFPSFLRQLAAIEKRKVHRFLRLAYLGGEAVLASDLAAARRLFPAAELSVGLNSSETGLTCLHLIPRGSALPDPVPAGRPVIDVGVSIVDAGGLSVPLGEPGEIEIASEYVRPRYWDIQTIAEGGSPAPVFRTGDRGRLDADGIVYHLGRVDGMVKVRGYRVETAEVEAVISVLDGVAEVAVCGIGEDPSAVELVACVVEQGAGVNHMDIRSAVARELPPAMIPTRVVTVDRLPRTANGKLDRKGLAKLASSQGSPAEYVAQSVNGSNGTRFRPDRGLLRADVQRRVVGIWASVLGVEDVRVGDDFFALGGTSISGVSVIARVRGEFGVRVPLAVLFETPTVTALVDAVVELGCESALETAHTARETVVRLVGEADFLDICALVNHYIESTTFNFRTDPQTPGEWVEEWRATRVRYPWLVAIADDRLAGVAYAGPWKGRAAYDWCAEVTVYVARDAQRTGIGRALYRRLLELLDEQGFHTQLAVITLPNEPSVALHEAHDFQRVGVLSRVGYKHGKWLDVGFWQRCGREGDEPPEPTVDVHEGAA